MAAIAFISHFESKASNAGKINLKLFLKQFYAQITPPKLTLNYSLPIEIFIKSSRECILSNFCINPYFKEILVDIKDYTQIYYLFKTLSIGENEIAQTIFLLHFSKSKIGNVLDFITIMKDVGSIQIVKNVNEYPFYNSLCDIYDKILKNKHLKQKVQEVIKSIIGAESNYNFDETKFVFFTSFLNGLHGFAGINTVYINIEMFSQICQFPKYSYNDQLIILKMNFVRIITHEISHVAIRFKKNDFNMSSPVEKKKKTITDLSTDYDPLIAYEAGALVEEKIFNGRIDWVLSVQNNVKVDYCMKFLNQLFNDECPEFNITESRTVLRKDTIQTMAIDIDLHYYSFVFE